MDNLKIRLYALTLDCKDPGILAKFYRDLLHWIIAFESEDFAVLAPPDSSQGAYPCITFQRNPSYVPPVWPEEPEAQQQMAHLDFAVNDMEAAISHAIHCGALEASQQFSEGWHVMLDPAGHPFCLCAMKPLFLSPDFALL